MTPKVVAIGEAMIELAPVGGGLYRRGFAGDTFNTIGHMAQLLGEKARCGFVTRIGCDALSDEFATEIAADGLEISDLARDPNRTLGLYLIQLDRAERSFHYWRGDSAARRLADDPKALATAVAGSTLVHLSGITLAILSPEGRDTLFEVLAEVRQAGAKVAFDPNFRPRLWRSGDEAKGSVGHMLTLTDIVLPSYDDERNLWNDRSPEATIQRFASAGVREVILKDGEKGVHIISNGAPRFIKAEPASNVIDTSGAGDAFNAGYLAARLNGASLTSAVDAGQRLAVEVLTHPGARAPREAVRAVAKHLG